MSTTISYQGKTSQNHKITSHPSNDLNQKGIIVGKDVNQLEPSYTAGCWWEYKMVQPLSMAVGTQIRKHLPQDSAAIQLPGVWQKEMKTGLFPCSQPNRGPRAVGPTSKREVPFPAHQDPHLWCPLWSHRGMQVCQGVRRPPSRNRAPFLQRGVFVTHFISMK